MKYIDVDPDGRIVLTRGDGEHIVIRLERKSGRRARLAVDAPDSVRVEHESEPPKRGNE